MNRLVKRYPELMELNQKLRHDVLDAISDKELSRPVKRGTYSLPLEITACTYRESLIIFAGKASLYLHSLGRPVSAHLKGFVGQGVGQGRPGQADAVLRSPYLNPAASAGLARTRSRWGSPVRFRRCSAAVFAAQVL